MYKMASSILTKFIIILIVLIILLQIVHLILLYQLESIKVENENYAKLKERGYLDVKQLDLDKYRIFKKIKNSHILDSSGQYHIINNLLNNLRDYEGSILDYDQQQFNNQPNLNPNVNQLNQFNSKPNDLTLITQCSASRLYYIEDLLNAYHGPISLSIFTLGKKIPELVKVLILLRKCLPLFKDFVKVHLVYPLTSDSYSIQLPDIDQHNLSCLTLSHKLASLRKHKEEFKFYGEGNGIQYPVNLLRNVARKNAETNYILVLDIDLIPSKNLRKDFLHFIKQSQIKLTNSQTVNLNDRIVFVLPVYEIDLNNGINLANIYKEGNLEDNPDDLNDNLNNFKSNLNFKNNHLGINLGSIVGTNFGANTIPTNKTILIELIKKRLVRPFYYELCFKCQRSTNYDDWQISDPDDPLHVLFEIFWSDPYEPFYIAMNNNFLPFYDERFRQYGFNRISQVCELNIANYRFLALNNHFLVHKGFKKADKFHRDKDLELEKNRLLFRQFKNELKLKYPLSDKRC